ncbi:hypothetical protein KRX19_09200 [Cardiobacteriaceae bacterium TAE3-ERU3]|nr:hypothetical protein [Cardiobacteriaceae bacterium TAE3-ERU3]
MNKIFLAASLAAVIHTADAADMLIHAAGDEQPLALEHDAFRISEQKATNLLATMLFTELLKDSGMRYSIASDAPILQELGAAPEADGCTLLAVELHFNPEDQPDGAGTGLWIATDPEDETASELAQYVLETWTTKTHSPYRSVPLHHVQPDAYSDPYSGESCPAIYVNLDTFSTSDPNLWPTQAQSMQYYARDLAHAINAALNLQAMENK